MEFFEVLLIPLVAALDWWMKFWSADNFLMQLFLGLIFVNLLYRFILAPLLRGDSGSDRADEHPKKDR